MSTARKRRADGLLANDAQIQDALKRCDTNPVSARTRSRKDPPQNNPVVSDLGSHKSSKSGKTKKVDFAKGGQIGKSSKKDEEDRANITKATRSKKTNKTAIEPKSQSTPSASSSGRAVVAKGKTGKRETLPKKGSYSTASHPSEAAPTTKVPDRKRSVKKTVPITQSVTENKSTSAIKSPKITVPKRRGRKTIGLEPGKVDLLRTTPATLPPGKTTGSTGGNAVIRSKALYGQLTKLDTSQITGNVHSTSKTSQSTGNVHSASKTSQSAGDVHSAFKTKSANKTAGRTSIKSRKTSVGKDKTSARENPQSFAGRVASEGVCVTSKDLVDDCSVAKKRKVTKGSKSRSKVSDSDVSSAWASATVNLTNAERSTDKSLPQQKVAREKKATQGNLQSTNRSSVDASASEKGVDSGTSAKCSKEVSLAPPKVPTKKASQGRKKVQTDVPLKQLSVKRGKAQGKKKAGKMDWQDGEECAMEVDTEEPVAPSGKAEAAGGDSGTPPVEDGEDNCPICMCPMENPKALDKCRHKFCTGCIDQCFAKMIPKCPICGELYGELCGNQPQGTMQIFMDEFTQLPGYEGCGSVVIQYRFPPGTQGEKHPKPGHPYYGTCRIAFLPNNAEGQKVTELLKRAFECGLTFTVGQSATTGLDDQVIWNDIHHKTRVIGGPAAFGYPDPTYLNRVQQELAIKGIR